MASGGSDARARHASTGRRNGARCPCCFGSGGAGHRPQGRGQEDLEGERSPGRTVLVTFRYPFRSAPGTNSSVEQGPEAATLPVESGPVPLPARVGEAGRGSKPGARSMTWGNLRRLRSSWRPLGGCVEDGRAIGRPEPIGSAGLRCSSWLRKQSGGGIGSGGTARGATAAVTRCGYRRGDSSRGTKCVAGKGERQRGCRHVRWQSGSPGNAANPRIGSRLQYACDLRERQSAEVVQNHMSGRASGVASRGVPAAATLAGPNPEAGRWRGVPTNPMRGGCACCGGFHHGGAARAGWRLRRGGKGHGGCA